MTIAALIVAAGRGSRAASAASVPKQYAVLGGATVLERSIICVASHPSVDAVQVVIHPEDANLYATTVEELACAKLRSPVHGGATRQESVLAGLRALAQSRPDIVLIHDAARPFLTKDVVDRLLSGLTTHAGAIAALPVGDTLKKEGSEGLIESTVDRARLWRAQTPQAFVFDGILQAHETAFARGIADLTDDASVAALAGIDVVLVPGSERNIKLTTAEDLAMAEEMLSVRAPAPSIETRSGSGVDVHRLVPGDAVWLCGLEIPHSHRLEGHSDADVALHALTDALLGAIGAGDIGQHFPPSDERWRGAASHIFLAHAGSLISARGGRIVNADITILAEAPRIGPHRQAMCRRVADILGIEPGRVSVKATTTEGLGFTGRREGIAAMATASVALPRE
ncbi:MAG: bifunctional 2-C-methyl-D-erythritol 4-phosphate cytidylyltransferase/2-C-methyl-D-erythritol 2,4-cyclodiphosphate synthase [Hyphomicrobiaceae bacterium]